MKERKGPRLSLGLPLIAAAALGMAVGWKLSAVPAGTAGRPPEAGGRQEPQVDAARFAQFLRLAEAGDYEGMERAGGETFPVGAILPREWPERLGPWRQGGPPEAATYLFLDDEMGGLRRKAMLLVDASNGAVMEFLAESLRMIP